MNTAMMWQEGDKEAEATAEERAELDDAVRRPMARYTTEEILAELGLRFQGFVFFAYLRRGDDSSSWRQHSHGDGLTALGLATVMTDKMRDSWR